MESLKSGINIRLFQRKAYPGILVVISYAQNLRPAANLVIYVENIIDSVVFHIYRIVILLRLEFFKRFRQGIQFHERSDIQIIFLHQFLIPDCIIGNCIVLISRHPVYPIAYRHGRPIFFRHHFIESRHIFSYHIRNVAVCPQSNIRHIVLSGTENNIIRFVGADNDIAAVVPRPPRYNLHFDVNPYLSPYILIDLPYP